MSKRTLAICSAVHTLHDGLSDVTYVLLPLLANAFGLSLAQVGLIRGAHRAAMAAFQIPAGIVAERLGERELLAFGTLLAGAAFTALGYAQGFWAILAALFLAGAGSAVQHPLASTLVSRAYPVQGRRAALGTYNFAGDVGKFAFGGLVSLLLLAGISWQAPVIGFGVVAVVTAIAVLSLLAARTHAGPTAHPVSARGATDWGIRDRPRFLALCLIEVLDSSTRSAFLTFIAFLPHAPVTTEAPYVSFQWLMDPFTVMPIQMFNWVSRPQEAFHLNAAAAGLVLLVMTLIMNGLAIYIRFRFRKRIKW